MTRTPPELTHRLQVACGLALIVLSLPFLGSLAGLGVLPAPGAIGQRIAVVLAAVGAIVLQPGLWRWRAARVVARRYGDQDVAVVCRLPDDPLFVRLLVVHPTDGLHVLMLDGSPMATWSWADVRAAEVAQTRMLLVRRWTALVVEAGGQQHRFVLLGASGMTAPWELADRVREAVATRASVA
jgi:hypothetical protein